MERAKLQRQRLLLAEAIFVMRAAYPFTTASSTSLADRRGTSTSSIIPAGLPLPHLPWPATLYRDGGVVD